MGGKLSRHPDYLLNELSFDQLAGWIAWFELETRGHRRTDIWLTALRKDIRGPHVETPDDPADLLPNFRHEPEEPVDQETEHNVNTALMQVPLM